MEFKPNHFRCIEDFRDGVLLLIDKPLNWTSFDVVNKIRWHLSRKLNVKRLKVGHAGTLDPLATGLLLICTGKMTKQIQHLIAEDKGYTGTFTFGETTPSFDRETQVDQNYPIDHLTEDVIVSAANSFTPGYMQTAPAFSAKKVKGKPAYLAARKGKAVEIPPRHVMIDSFKITRVALPEADFDIKCSKGTYIRSIANDIGKKVESGACLSALRRYSSGAFHVDDAIQVDAFLEAISDLPLTELTNK